MNTTGVGSLDMKFETEQGDVTLSLNDAHRIDIPEDLISLGKLIRDGCEFHAISEDDIHLVTPCGTHIPVKLDSTCLFTLEYEPVMHRARANYVANRGRQRTYHQLHQIFGHASYARCVATLGVTEGMKHAKGDLEDFFCAVCALANSTRKPISSKPRVPRRPPMPPSSLAKATPLLPWERTYADIKTLPTTTRGGNKYAIFYVDSTFTFIMVSLQSHEHMKLPTSSLFRSACTSCSINAQF